MIHLKDIPYPLEVNTVLSRMNTTSSQKHAKGVEKMIGLAKEHIKPQIIYKKSLVVHHDDRSVHLDGILFNSRILRVNLNNAYISFPYVITCGNSFDDFKQSIEDMLDRFYLDEIGNIILAETQSYFLNFIKESYHLKKVAKMNPGSLADWPLEQQRPLFSVLNETAVAEKIGVSLTDNMLMTPAKSLSGIAFPTDVDFENCQMCPQKDCPGRKAPYDDSMINKYF